MTLRDLPPVRALAEERAREVHDAAVRAIKARHVGSYAQSLIDTLPPMWVDVDAHLALLCDLTHPDSRDAVARLVAEKVPNLQAWEVTAGCESGGGRLNMVLRACGMPEVDRWEPDPTPVDALRLIASKVLA